MLKVSTFCVDACLQSFSEGQDSFLDRILWGQVVPDRLQHFSQFSDVLRLRHTLLVSVQHRSPDVKVEQIKTWGVGRPLVLPDEVRRILLQPILRMAWTCEQEHRPAEMCCHQASGVHSRQSASAKAHARNSRGLSWPCRRQSEDVLCR